MGCEDACIDMGYDETNSFYSEAARKARKSRPCCECGESIAVGSVYQRSAGKSDGTVWSFATCQECAEIRKALVCGSWVFGWLWEHINDYTFPIWLRTSPIDCLAKIESLSARNTIRRRFEAWESERREGRG